MICTFYSYKGGVGRTMALANIAELFYQEGLKVLMVDWDLEAPGLERFFPSLDLNSALENPGLIDMLLQYKERISQDVNKEDSVTFESLNSYLLRVYPDQQSSGQLLLLTAGRRSRSFFAEYARSVLTFDWQDFYESWGGELYFNWLREKFEELADVILIDSRTGVTEMGGVCTYQMADAIVMFCAPNQQNVNGVLDMAQNFGAPEVKHFRRGRSLDILVVPARIERAESESLDEFQEEFIRLFKDLVPWTKGIDIHRLWQLRIPYVPKYAYSETVAVRESGQATAEEMAPAFRNLMQVLDSLRLESKGKLVTDVTVEETPYLKRARDLVSQDRFVEALETLRDARQLPSITKQELLHVKSIEQEINQVRLKRARVLIDELEDLLQKKPAELTLADIDRGNSVLTRLQDVHPNLADIESLIERWQSYQRLIKIKPKYFSLIDYLDQDQQRVITSTRRAAERIWAEPLHRYYTDHTVTHSERIIVLLDGLTFGMMDTDKRLSSTEIVVLLAAAYLHNIGMQDERFANEDLETIRDTHQEATAELIYRALEAPKAAINLGLPNDPALVEMVSLVVKGHRRANLAGSEYDTFVHGTEMVRPRLLAALLRFADELDIDHRRVDLELMNLLELPAEIKLNWWKCHYISGFSIGNEYIRITYRLPKDRPNYEELIVPLVEADIRAKLSDLEDIFRANKIKIAMGRSEARFMRLVKSLPPEIEELLQDEKIQVAQMVGSLESTAQITGAELNVYSHFKATPSNLRRSFDALIRNMIQGFIGRRFVFDALDEFLQTYESGYFIIRGTPGVGKTALVAKLINERGYIHHFNIASQNIRSPRLFLENVCAQLIERYKLEHDEIPHRAFDDSSFLMQCLGEAASDIKNHPIVLVIDALNEADQLGLSPAANSLYLPFLLPEGVHIVVTTRPMSDLRLQVAQQVVFDMETVSEKNMQDVTAYIEIYTKREEMRARLKTWGVSVEQFVAATRAKSQGNFMYLSYVLPAIEKGRFVKGTLDELPESLMAYYRRHWRQMREGNESAFDEVYEPIVCILGVAQEPVTVQQIANWTKLQQGQVRESVRLWREFLKEEQAEGARRYCIYDYSFKDFLKEQVDLLRYDDMIANYYLALADVESHKVIPGKVS